MAVSNEQDLVVEECQPLLGLGEESNQSLAQYRFFSRLYSS